MRAAGTGCRRCSGGSRVGEPVPSIRETFFNNIELVCCAYPGLKMSNDKQIRQVQRYGLIIFLFLRRIAKHVPKDMHLEIYFYSVDIYQINMTL